MDTSTKKRVGIFARGLTQGGVTRVLLNILRELNTSTAAEYIVITDDISIATDYPNITFVEVTAPHKLLWDYWSSLIAARKLKLDVAVYTKNIIPLSHVLLSARKLTLVYDLGYFDKSIQAYPPLDTLYMKTQFKVSSWLASHILVISEYTKQDMVKILNTPPEKISVMLLAAEEQYKRPSEDEIARVREKYHLTAPFLLYCGNLSERKNIKRTIEAVNTLHETIPHHLYIAGPKTLGSESVLDEGTELLGDRFRHIGFIDEEDMPALYAGADIYLFASLYEGFGLPILEAQAIETPVLTSSVTSCPEVAGEGAYIADPYSVEDIAAGIARILSDDTYRKELTAKGKVNAADYTWEKTAKIFEETVARL